MVVFGICVSGFFRGWMVDLSDQKHYLLIFESRDKQLYFDMQLVFLKKERSVNFKMSFWCLQYPLKNEQKQVNLRFHSSKVKFVCSFFGGNFGLKNHFNFF